MNKAVVTLYKTLVTLLWL